MTKDADRIDTVTGLLSASAETAGEVTALHYAGEAISYRELEAMSRRAAGGLAKLGIGVGDRIAFWLPNTPAYLALAFGCARLGAIAVAVNTRYRAGEVEDIVGRTGAKALVMWPGFRGIDFPEILARVDPTALAALETVIVYSEDEAAPDVEIEGKRTVDCAAVLAAAPLDDDRAEADLGTNIFTTSGTTRAPKFVLHSNAGIAVHAAEVAEDFGLHKPEAVVLMALPLCGVYGYASAMAAFAAAKPVVLMPAFEAVEMLKLLRHHEVTHFNGSDDMIDRLLAAADSDEPFRHADFAGYATFNSSLDDIVERAEARGLRLVSLWGMSEMQALVARRDPAADAAERKRMGGALASPRARARVRDPASGELQPVGAAGELEITGPSRMIGYYDDRQATAEALCEDGFVKTGDLAAMEEDGGFEFLSRMGDVLRLGGFLVSPAEIEAEVQAHPAVEAAQVVEAPTAAGERAVAFVIPADGETVDEAAVRDHCAGRLANYKVPARVVALEEFPVTMSANGVKIQRTKLREMAKAVLGEGEG